MSKSISKSKGRTYAPRTGAQVKKQFKKFAKKVAPYIVGYVVLTEYAMYQLSGHLANFKFLVVFAWFLFIFKYLLASNINR